MSHEQSRHILNELWADFNAHITSNQSRCTSSPAHNCIKRFFSCTYQPCLQYSAVDKRSSCLTRRLGPLPLLRVASLVFFQYPRHFIIFSCCFSWSDLSLYLAVHSFALLVFPLLNRHLSIRASFPRSTVISPGRVVQAVICATM